MEVSDKKHNHIIVQYIVLLFSEVNIAAARSFFLDPLTVFIWLSSRQRQHPTNQAIFETRETRDKK